MELFGARALREVAADDDKVGFQLVDPPLDRFNQPLVMSAEMKIREVDEASHAIMNAPSSRGSRGSVVAGTKEQFDVDPETFGPLLFDEVRDLFARDEMDIDVLVLIAPAFANLADAVDANERKAFRQHPGEA